MSFLGGTVQRIRITDQDGRPGRCDVRVVSGLLCRGRGPEKTVDWSVVDAQCQEVLDANPACPAAAAHQLQCAAVVARGPSGRRHGLGQRAAVRVSGGGFSRLSPRRGRSDLRELVAHLEAKFGPHMAGYHPCGQNTDEWFYQETWGPALNGYAQGDLRAWRAWLAGALRRRCRAAPGMA